MKHDPKVGVDGVAAIPVRAEHCCSGRRARRRANPKGQFENDFGMALSHCTGPEPSAVVERQVSLYVEDWLNSKI